MIAAETRYLDRRRNLSVTAFHIYLGVSVLLYVIVYTGAPMAIEPTAGHDDGLYIRLGQSLAKGHWLGPFNQFTLMKGPGYPAFLAVANWIGLPVSLAHALFHGAAITFVTMLFRRFIVGVLPVAALFTLLLWHPVFLANPFLRVVRDGVFSTQSLVFLATFAWALLGTAAARERAIYSVFSGLILGWLWLTREEALWIFAGITVVMLAAIWNAWREQKLRTLLVSCTIFALSFIATQAAFRTVNGRVYGKFVGVDVKERHFQRALGAIQGVRSGSWRPYVAVTHDTMEKIYAVSPSFALLRPHLDGEIGKAWARTSCDTYGVTCGDIGAGWFMWALRDAAAAGGFYASPEKASNFFGQVADEISAACARGELVCSLQLVSEMPYYSWEQLAQFPSRYVDFLKLLLMWHRPSLDQGPSTGDPVFLGEALRFLHYPFHSRSRDDPRPISWAIRGWYYRFADQWFSASLKDANGLRALEFDRANSPDLVAHFHNARASQQRFELRFDCALSCILRVARPDNVAVERRLGDLPTQPFRWNLGDAMFHVDALYRSDTDFVKLPQNVLSDRVRSLLLGYYNVVFFPVLALGVLAFMVASVRHWRVCLSNTCYVIALAAWTLALSRIALLAFVEATSMQAWSFKYVGPAYLLLPCAAVLSGIAWRQLSGVARFRVEPTVASSP